MPDRLRASIAVCLRHHPTIGLGILYGSLQRGTAGPASDLDLAVMGARVVSIAERMALIESLARRVGCPIDLVDLRAAQRGLGRRNGNARRLRLRNGKAGRYPTLSVEMGIPAG